MLNTNWETASKDLEVVKKLTFALEDYARLLSGCEVLEGAQARVVSVALESIDPDFDIKEGSKVTLRAIKEGIVKGTKAAIELFKWLWELLQSFYVKFTGSIRRVRKNQMAISRRLGKLGNKTTTGSIIISGIQRLSVNGSFVGTSVDDLMNVKDLTNYILNVYPKSVVKISRDTSRGFLNILDNADENTNLADVTNRCINTYIDMVEKNFVTPPGVSKVNSNEDDGETKGYSRSVVLPGNIAFLFNTPEHARRLIEDSGRNREKVIDVTLVMRFTELPLNVADRSEREIDAPSISELNDLVNTISQILTLAEKNQSGRQDFESVRTVVNDAIRQIAEESEGNYHSNVLFLLGEISKKLAEPVGFYTHWLAVTLNVWLTFISHCIRHYETEGF